MTPIQKSAITSLTIGAGAYIIGKRFTHLFNGASYNGLFLATGMVMVAEAIQEKLASSKDECFCLSVAKKLSVVWFGAALAFGMSKALKGKVKLTGEAILKFAIIQGVVMLIVHGFKNMTCREVKWAIKCAKKEVTANDLRKCARRSFLIYMGLVYGDSSYLKEDLMIAFHERLKNEIGKDALKKKLKKNSSFFSTFPENVQTQVARLVDSTPDKLKPKEK
ncbi:hypothetical protein [Candidatus Neptunochlamydia vexilliferae]|uniref:Uncharacterized protein n=1 Tax=Candidatus Neptunichlamydia vexilliferae TaxID=1651774 RepID=A0ABS0B171_9BACT|nr:hypothetical protein [Candidatus Neptunochlamydia vexilliferae]MBF5059940.1 hypothetical protein [Candidatus Neptunochlamydia vexilliferae]